MTWWKPTTWFAKRPPPAEKVTYGPGYSDHVFHRVTGYHVITKPAGFFDGHKDGEGRDPFVIIRCLDRALPEQRRAVEEFAPVAATDPAQALSLQLMAEFKNDKQMGAPDTLWGTRVTPAMAVDPWFRTRALGEVGPAVVDGKVARCTVTIRFAPVAGNVEPNVRMLKRLCSDANTLRAPDLVKGLKLESVRTFLDGDRHSIEAVIAIKLRAVKSSWPDRWSGKMSAGWRSHYVLRLRADAVFDEAHRAPSMLANVYEFTPEELPTFFEEGSTQDQRERMRAIDTNRNAVRQVGTGYAFATIQAAINASASGDIVEVYGNGLTPLISGAYNENVVDNGLNGIQVIGMCPDQGVRVWSNAGRIFEVINNNAWHIENFQIDGNGGANTGVYLDTAPGSCVKRCRIYNVLQDGIYDNSQNGLMENNVIYSCVRYGVAMQAQCTNRYQHNTSCKNTSTGIWAVGAGVWGVYGNVCTGNVVADYTNIGAQAAWNSSGDLTAPGISPQPGFLNTDFINYAGNDYRLRTATMLTTRAMFEGYPLSREDFQTMLRDRDGMFWAGASHPWLAPTWPGGVSNIVQVP